MKQVCYPKTSPKALTEFFKSVPQIKFTTAELAYLFGWAEEHFRSRYQFSGDYDVLYPINGEGEAWDGTLNKDILDHVMIGGWGTVRRTLYPLISGPNVDRSVTTYVEIIVAFLKRNPLCAFTRSQILSYISNHWYPERVEHRESFESLLGVAFSVFAKVYGRLHKVDDHEPYTRFGFGSGYAVDLRFAKDLTWDEVWGPAPITAAQQTYENAVDEEELVGAELQEDRDLTQVVALLDASPSTRFTHVAVAYNLNFSVNYAVQLLSLGICRGEVAHLSIGASHLCYLSTNHPDTVLVYGWGDEPETDRRSVYPLHVSGDNFGVGLRTAVEIVSSFLHLNPFVEFTGKQVIGEAMKFCPSQFRESITSALYVIRAGMSGLKTTFTSTPNLECARFGEIGCPDLVPVSLTASFEEIWVEHQPDKVTEDVAEVDRRVNLEAEVHALESQKKALLVSIEVEDELGELGEKRDALRREVLELTATLEKLLDGGGEG